MQVLYNPKVLLPTYSEVFDLQIADASELAEVGELLSFWDLVMRCQIRGEVGGCGRAGGRQK